MADVVVGIDPGVTGGVAVMSLGGDVSHVHPMPVVKTGKGTEVDAAHLSDLIERVAFSHTVRLAAVERVSARPGQGVCSVFSFGMGYGIVRGVLGTLGIPVELPTPQTWQKAVLGACPAGTSKAASVAYCSRRFPGLKLTGTDRSRKPHEGICDALAIAEWARRLVVGTKGERSKA